MGLRARSLAALALLLQLVLPAQASGLVGVRALETPGYAQALEVVGGAACVAEGSSGLRVIELGPEYGTDTDGDGWPGFQNRCPTVADADQADRGADGLGDVCDSCPFRANREQLDRGGVAASQYTPGDGSPDGIGDVCQCGDMNADGIVNGADIVLYRRHFAGLVSPLSTDLCSVTGPGGVCDGSDAVVMRRTFAGLTTGIHQYVCSAVLGP